MLVETLNYSEYLTNVSYLSLLDLPPEFDITLIKHLDNAKATH